MSGTAFNVLIAALVALGIGLMGYGAYAAQVAETATRECHEACAPYASRTLDGCECQGTDLRWGAETVKSHR